MPPSDIFLFCFAFGAIWTLAGFALGGHHFGHSHGGHFHGHGSGVHSPGHGHVSGVASWVASLLNPGGLGVFLAWFGGVGYLLTRHTGLLLGIDLAIAAAVGLLGAWILGLFLGFLHSHEKPLNPSDYEMVGVLGKTSSPIRPDGVGEVIYIRDGARRPVCARSEDDVPIRRGEEVVVVRFEKGIAYVRTWDAMLTQSGSSETSPETLR